MQSAVVVRGVTTTDVVTESVQTKPQVGSRYGASIATRLRLHKNHYINQSL